MAFFFCLSWIVGLQNFIKLMKAMWEKDLFTNKNLIIKPINKWRTKWQRWRCDVCFEDGDSNIKGLRAAFEKLSNLLNTYTEMPVLDLAAKLNNEMSIVSYAIIPILFTHLFLSELYMYWMRVDLQGLVWRQESLVLLSHPWFLLPKATSSNACFCLHISK